MLYYSAMCLALSQILFKGSGADSLDRAREEHKHHGLVFSSAPQQKSDYRLKSAAAGLVARPMLNNGQRTGTFELWHRTAREDPIIGQHNTNKGGNSTTNPVKVLFISGDNSLPPLPKTGISFWDCLIGTPGMSDWLRQIGINSDIVKATIALETTSDDAHAFILAVHPHASKERIVEFQSDIACRPSDIDRLHVSEGEGFFTLRANGRGLDNPVFSLPSASTWTNEDIRFLPHKTSLNEFGYIYVGLYILGNYARYFPDRWMVDFESGSPLALAAAEFVSMAEWRMALLTLSELSRIYHVLRE
nr:hypothetical protein [Methylobacterium terrae]